MTDQRIDEKQEEKQEKDEEKRQEKSPQEKSWDEKWQRDPVSAVVWALIFIWAGVVLLLDNLGMLNRIISHNIIIPGIGFLPGEETWSIILLGAGVIVFGEVIFRLLVPEYRRPVGGSIFFAILLIGIGLHNLIGWDVIWPLILIALGLSVLLRGIFRKT